MPPDYGSALEIIDNLGAHARKVRLTRELSIRAAAAQAGLPHSLWWRLEEGTNVNLSTVIVVLGWLEENTREVTSRP